MNEWMKITANGKQQSHFSHCYEEIESKWTKKKNCDKRSQMKTESNKCVNPYNFLHIQRKIGSIGNGGDRVI